MQLRYKVGEVHASINLPISSSEQDIRIKTSLGITVYPQDASVMKELFKAADIALYRAKDTGKIDLRTLIKWCHEFSR